MLDSCFCTYLTVRTSEQVQSFHAFGSLQNLSAAFLEIDNATFELSICLDDIELHHETIQDRS